MFKIFDLFGEMAVLDTLIHGGISHDDPEKYFHTGEQKTKKSIWKEKWSFCFQIKRKNGVIIKKKKKGECGAALFSKDKTVYKTL